MMNGISIRLNLLSEVLSKLHSAIVDPKGKFRHFVRIKRTQLVGPHFEVDLNILNGYDTGHLNEVDPMKRVAVTREMVGELFDVLGLFPRTNQDDGEHSKILAEIRQNLGAIWSKSGSPTAPWLRQPLKRIEELLISLEKV